MPEISVDKLSAKLDTIPEADREGYVQALQGQGYTWKAEAQLNDAVASPMQSTNGFQRGFPTGQIPQNSVDQAIDVGLLSNEPTSGILNNTARAVPSIVGGMIRGPRGAAAGEALRQGAVYLNSRSGATQAPTISDATIRPAIAAGTQIIGDAAAPYVAAGISGLAKGIGNTASNVLEYGGVNLAGVKQAAYDVAKTGADKVRAFIGAEPAVGDNLAQNVRGLIAGAVSKGEKEYPKLIDAAKADPAYAGKTFDLQSAIGDKALEIGDKFKLIRTPNLEANPGAAKYWKFAGQLDRLSNASLDEVHGFQQQLNGLASEYAGKPLGAAFRQLQGKVRSFLGNEIPEIGKANAAYAAAKTLEEQTGKLTNANDLLAHIARVSRNPQDTLEKQALTSASDKVPGLADALGNVDAYHAAQSFGPLVRGLPQTGMGASIASGFIKQPVMAAMGTQYVTGNPVLAGAAGVGTFARNVTVSPRLSLAALGAAQKAGPLLADAAQATAKGAGALVPALSQALSHMSPASVSVLQSFYRSPEPR